MQQKDLSLEGLRGVASFSVLLAHFVSAFLPYIPHNLFRAGGSIPRKYEWESIISQPFFTVFMNGAFAVQIFFVLSGYVLTKKFFDTGDVRSLQAGAIKRYPRLVIPVFVSCSFAWALMNLGAMYTHAAPQIGAAGWPMIYYTAPIEFWAAIAGSLFNIPFFSMGAAINSPLWTIYFEMLGSLLLFGAYALFGRHRPLITFIAFMVATLRLTAGSQHMLYFLAIYAGSVIHHVEARLRQSPALGAFLVALGLVVGAFDYSRLYANFHKITLPTLPWPFFDLEAHETLLYTTLGAVLLVCGVIGCRPVARALSSRACVFLGQISFSLYLLHWPIICSLSFGLMNLLVVKLSWAYLPALSLTTVITIAVSLAASYLMARLVDQPATILASRFSSWILHPAPHQEVAKIIARPIILTARTAASKSNPTTSSDLSAPLP